MACSLEQTRDEFEAFQRYCFELRLLHNTHEALFAESHNIVMLEKVASAFFNDLNRWLLELYYLQVSRLTDPAKSNKNSNLTVAHFLECLLELKIATQCIEVLAGKLQCYGEIVKVARNKLIAHIDINAARGNGAFGDHTQEELRQFFVDLQRFTDEAAVALGLEPLDYQGTSNPGDVMDLLKFLRVASALR